VCACVYIHTYIHTYIYKVQNGKGVANAEESNRQTSGEGGGKEGRNSGVLRPVSALETELVNKLGRIEGIRAHRRLEKSARNSILQALYAFRWVHYFFFLFFLGVARGSA
jgi:hypothetical protein